MNEDYVTVTDLQNIETQNEAEGAEKEAKKNEIAQEKAEIEDDEVKVVAGVTPQTADEEAEISDKEDRISVKNDVRNEGFCEKVENLKLPHEKGEVAKGKVEDAGDIDQMIVNNDHENENFIESEENLTLETVENNFKAWISRRQETISRLKEIASFIESFNRKTTIAKAVGSGSGILAGGLTVVGGALTIAATGGIAAVPMLIAGAGVGIAAGVTGGAATISQKVVKSKQLKAAKEALQLDQESTLELQDQIKLLSQNKKLMKKIVFDVAKSGGSITSESFKISGLVTASSSGLLTQGIKFTASVFGDDAAKKLSEILLVTSGRVVSGALSVVTGGVVMAYDIYQLTNQMEVILKKGATEGAAEVRTIADHLERNLNEIKGCEE